MLLISQSALRIGRICRLLMAFQHGRRIGHRNIYLILRLIKYAVKSAPGDLIALAAYQIRGRSAYVYILYAESAPHSNPAINPVGQRKYYGIGELLIVCGIKYSIDHVCHGDVVFDTKTDELARHYELDFHARRIPSVESGGPKRYSYMLADEDARWLFAKYLKEGEP